MSTWLGRLWSYLLYLVIMSQALPHPPKTHRGPVPGYPSVPTQWFFKPGRSLHDHQSTVTIQCLWYQYIGYGPCHFYNAYHVIILVCCRNNQWQLLSAESFYQNMKTQVSLIEACAVPEMILINVCGSAYVPLLVSPLLKCNDRLWDTNQTQHATTGRRL